MKKNYKIVIPSYKRAETLKTKTLSVLEGYGIPASNIDIWVADDNEYEVYTQSYKGTPYENNIRIGVPTIGAQRNHIEKSYDEGTYLVMFDDDLEGIYRKNDAKLERVEDLEKEVIVRGFTECERVGSKTWGIYAASNPFFMKNRTSTDLCYIIASMFGVIVQHHPFLERVTNHGEDYEYSIRQWIHNGIVVRLDDITVKSNYYGEAGGLQEIRNEQYIYDSIKWIADEFPKHCKMYIRKTTGHAELRLKDRTIKGKQGLKRNPEKPWLIL